MGRERQVSNNSKSPINYFKSYIQWTPHAKLIPLCYVGVDHGGLEIHVPQEFLYGPDVVTVFKQMRGKAVHECVDGLLIIPACVAARLTYFCGVFECT